MGTIKIFLRIIKTCKNNNLQYRKESSAKNKDKGVPFYICVSTYYKVIAVS